MLVAAVGKYLALKGKSNRKIYKSEKYDHSCLQTKRLSIDQNDKSVQNKLED
jgi:hypothetical protein